MSKADSLLKKATSFEKLALYSDRKAFLYALAQDVGGNPTPSDAFSNKETEQWNSQTQPKGIPAPQPNAGSPMTPPPAMNAPAVREQQKSAPQAQRLDPNAQKALSEYVATKGIGMPIDPKEYGRMGPTTRQALDNYKRDPKTTNKNLTDAQIFQAMMASQQLSQQFPS